MAFDLLEQSIVHISPLSECLQNLQFVLELLICTVHVCNQVCHVTNSIRVKSYAKDDPADNKNLLVSCCCIDVTEANSCERIECEIKTLCILLAYISILKIVTHNPCLWSKIFKFSYQKPKASCKMGQEKHRQENCNQLLHLLGEIKCGGKFLECL